MSQFTWTLLGQNGGQYEVGLYHGDESKHVIVYVDREPIIIDFNITESKSYSFYIGHELCEMNLTIDADNYHYSLTTNRDADTPLNLARRALTKKYKTWLLAIAVSLIAGISLLSYIVL